MPSLARALLRIAAVLLVLQLGASVASAHDCASQADCEETSGYLGGISIIGGIIAIFTGLLGSELGGAIPGVRSGGDKGGEAEPERPSRPEPGVVTAEPGVEAPPAGEAEPEVPWDDLIAATEPPADSPEEPEIPWDDLIAATEPPSDTGEPTIEELLGEPGLPPVDDLLGDEPFDDHFGEEPAEPGAEPVPTRGESGDLTDPLDGDPGIDDLVDELLGPEPNYEPNEELPPSDEPVEEPTAEPTEEPFEEPEPTEEPVEEPADEPADEAEEVEEGGTPKPPMLDTVERFTGLAGNVKDAADKLKEDLEDLPIPEEAVEKVNDFLDDVSDKAGKAKDVGEKAGEYIKVSDENLERTDKLGITPESQDFLLWWRITFRAAGELTQKFIDGVTAPVTKLLGKEYGDKATDMIHSAVPIKEFGEELSKLPTSAAETVIKAQRRDQISENVGLVPKGDAGYIELDDLFPGRKWP